MADIKDTTVLFVINLGTEDMTVLLIGTKMLQVAKDTRVPAQRSIDQENINKFNSVKLKIKCLKLEVV